jgi:hypothetical protein
VWEGGGCEMLWERGRMGWEGVLGRVETYEKTIPSGKVSPGLSSGIVMTLPVRVNSMVLSKQKPEYTLSFNNQVLWSVNNQSEKEPQVTPSWKVRSIYVSFC